MAGLESITSGINLSGAMSTTGTIMQFLLIGLVLGSIIFGVWYLLSFNIKVGINERNGNEGYITKWDKGKFVKDKKKGILIFSLMKDKRWNQPLDRKYLSVEKKAFGRISKIVMFAEDTEGRFQPIRPVEKDNLYNWTGWDNDDMEFASSNARAVIDMVKKPDFWSKYGMLVQLGAIAIIFVMAIVLFRQITQISESLNNVAGAFVSAAQALSGAVITNGTQVITSG